MADAAAPPPARKRRTRIWLWVAGTFAVLLLLLGGVGWWAGGQGSLLRALHMAQRFLPDDQSLVFSGVQGSVAGGGRIDRLQWSKPGTVMTIDDLRLDWSLRQLLGRDLRVRTLAIRNVHVRLNPQPEKPDEPPFTMPADVSLPVRLTLPLTIARLQIETVEADAVQGLHEFHDIAAHYRYDGTQHALRLESLRYGESHAQGDFRLHARNLTLAAQFAASLRDLVPDTPFAMLARMQVDGTLAGGDAANLALLLDARQQPHDAPPVAPANLLTDLAALRTSFEDEPAAGAVRADAARIHAEATIHPWRQQPAQQLLLQVRQLNAHAFHVQAPVTALRGRASIQPVANAASDTWDAVLDFTNDQPGAWDLQQLPLRQLAGRARLSLQWMDIESARADLGGRSSAGTVTLRGRIPFQQLAQTTLQLDLQEVDLRPLMTSLPRTAFSGPLTIQPREAESSQAQADIRNRIPGPLDRDLAPLDRLLADIHFAPEQWRIDTFELQIGTGAVQIQGDFAPATQQLNLRADLQDLLPREIHRKMASDLTSELSGKLSIAGTLQQGLAFRADVGSNTAGVAPPQRGQWEIQSIQANGNWSPARLTIERIHLDAFQAKVDGTDIDVGLPGLDSIKANLTATAPGVELTANAAMRQRSGGGKLSVQLASAEQLAAWLRGLPVIGEQLPDLQASGAATLQADWQGGWRQWRAGFSNPASQPQLRMNAIAHSDGLRIDVPATADRSATRIDVQKLDLDLQGNLMAATLAVNGDARANDARAVLDIRMRATQERSRAAPRWNIAVEKFTAAATLPDQTQPWELLLSEGLQLSVQPGADLELRASAGNATVSAPSGSDEALKLAWQPVLWRRSASGATTLQSIGTATGVQPAWLDLLGPKGQGPIERAGMRTDLSLSGEWNIQMTSSVNISAHLQRERGDLWLVEPETAAGIRTFDVKVQSAGENVNLALEWDTERAGVITARVGTRLVQRADGWSLPDDAPLSGNIDANLQNLNTWAFLAPPGWRIAGSLAAAVRLGGTVQKPQLDGNLEGNGLNLRSVLDGVDLHDGTLRATLSGSRMELAELTFQGGTGSRAYVRGFSGNLTSPPTARGSMTVTGSVDWSGVAKASEAESGIAMDLRAQLQQMQVLARNDRQMTLSGELSAGLAQGALRVRGNLTVDRASIVLPDASAPTLGDDVVIVRNTDLANPGAAEARARGELRTRKPMDMEIQLDLGNDLALEGQGITTRLEGELTVRSNTIGDDPFSVFGEVRTVQGRYRAWGQALNVETGVVRFNGPYSNPSLDLLAIRPEIDVRAGVRVTGTLNAPRAQLFSEPDLPEGEKLSWVVLGRPTLVAGAEGTSMQQAAISLAAGQLSGKLASGLGLDELGLGDAGVTIGKRLSNEFYLTYEAGLSGAASTLFIFYDITRRLTLRAQTGEASAVDMIYTIKFD